MLQDTSSSNAGVQSPFEHNERWLLIERVVSSPPFRKAGRLRDLIRYLADVSIRAERGEATGHELTEQGIGEAVFGKPAGYSPVEDSSVRVHVRQLRLKLHEYFDSEGRDEPLVVEIPKGSYGLTFHTAVTVTPETVELPASRRQGWLRFRIPLLALVAMAVGILTAFLWTTRVNARPAVPWPLSSVFSSSHHSWIVLADATYGIRRVLSQKPASLEDYIKRDFQQNGEMSRLKAADGYLARYSADALLTSWADVAVATTFLKTLPGELDQVSVRSARDLRLRDLEDGNYVFLGSPASNPWVLLFENRLNFQEVRGDETRGVVKYFRNRAPTAGEEATYQGLPRTGVNGDDYAALALLPSESRRGNVLIIQGLQQEGTEAAGLFLADEGGRQKLRAALGVHGEPAAPLYFEVLLKIRAVAGSPSSTSIVATRIIKP